MSHHNQYISSSMHEPVTQGCSLSVSVIQTTARTALAYCKTARLMLNGDPKKFPTPKG